MGDEGVTFQQAANTRMVTFKTYDNLNRLTAIVSLNSSVAVLSSFRYAYNAASQRTSVTNADSSRWQYGYDNLEQVASAKRNWSDNTAVAGQQFEYGFDDIGNRKTAASGGDQWGANLRYENYAANSLNQYTSRTVPASIDILGAAHSNATVTIWSSNASVMPVVTTRKGEYFRGEVRFTNAAGPVYLGITNIAVLQTPTHDIITTDIASLLHPHATESLNYDLDGNTTSDSLWTNQWNAEDRRITVESRSTVPTAARAREQWTHLPDGRWIERIVSTWSGSAYVPQSTNRYVWDHSVLLAILDHTNAVTHCIATCDLVRKPGPCGSPDWALRFMQQREVGNGPATQIYRLNNEVGAGVWISLDPGQTCTQGCLDALKNGLLYTISNGRPAPSPPRR